MLPFVLGTACVVMPQVGVPLLGTTAAVKGFKGLHRSLKQRRQGSPCAGPNPGGGAAAPLTLPGSAPTTTSSSSPAPAASVLLSSGQVPPVTLEWCDVSCSLLDKKRGTRKQLLSGIGGVARPGRLLALMGPSGSGKTTLLNTLAGQVPVNGALSLSGAVAVNGVPTAASTHCQAYVQQEDVFYSQLTVLETMKMAAALRLPPNMAAADKEEYVERLLTLLGLAKVRHTRVGDKKVRGLSGGERKRLSLGCELIGSPSLIFLDEPTSGLDAAAAQKVMATLHQLAAAGHTVVASIHQPRSSIWSMFDDLVLLHEGQLVYAGPADKALEHFASLGYECPPHTNPAEFLADLVGGEALPSSPQPGAKAAGEGGQEGEEGMSGRARVQTLVEAWRQQGLRAIKSPSEGVEPGATSPGPQGGAGLALRPRLPWHRQLLLLFRRSWKQAMRDKASTMARIGANVTSALMFGLIFFRMGRSQSAIQDRMGLLQVAAINTAMGSLVKTLNIFPRERLIVNRERARHSYHTACYLAGKLLAELPVSALFPLLFSTIVYPLCGLNPRLPRFLRFLAIITTESFTSSAFGLMVGAFAPSVEAAVAIGPAAMTLWIVFGGYYVNSDTVPGPLKWLPKASLIKQAFAALAINEFKGQRFEADPQGGGMTDGQQVLNWLSFGGSSVGGALVQQARIMAFYYIAAYSLLLAKKPTFQPLLPPPASGNELQRGLPEAAPRPQAT
ncbi:P-loop containing nucleoside triphosphate hydrolase protein [Haematococcus lacustris]